MADTAKFEAASIASYYQAINNGASAIPGASPDMTEAMDKEYPSMSNDWRTGILAGTEALLSYLNHTPGTKDTTWKYAHYDGRTKSIPATSTTDVLNYIWDSFGTEQKKIFAGKKDSWDTADVYIVKSNKEREIKNTVDDLKEQFSDLDPAIFVGTVNRYMSALLEQKILVPISLKQKTKNVNVRITPTNIALGPEGLEVQSGSIVTALNTRFQISSGRRASDFDFEGNSLRFEMEFEAGAYKKRYTWETKAGSKSADVTEPRDRAVNNKGKYVTAAARNGSIPGPEMAKLVKHYTNEDLNYNIPLNGKASDAQVKYWQAYYKKVLQMSSTTVPVDIVGPQIDKQTVSTDDFIKNMLLLDSGVPSGKNFATKIRAKLRHLRYIMMFLKANQQGKLGELIAHAYFLSSKMNITQADLAGPFVKVQ
jgi:hypothetical protein|tara:strand:+ start:55 stop:1326 length:1272 start_codon:yes stop_codon:yes gene_type:complete